MYVQAVGCDGRFGSHRRWDMCNVCGGRNNTCTHVAAVAFPTVPLHANRTVKHRADDISGYSAVLRIPRGATNVRMTDNSTNYLGN